MILHPRMLIATGLLAGAFLLVLSGVAAAHDIYRDWRSPKSGGSCCSGGETGDCYVAPARFENGQWYAQRREDNRWLAIPDNVILKDGATADGNAHLCAPAPLAEEDTRVYCFRPPLNGT